MIDHANELRRYARKIAHPAGDVPSVMLAAADEIERLAARLEATEEDRARFLVEMGRLCAQCDALRLRIKAAEKERDSTMRLADRLALALNTSNHERDNLRAKIAEMEKQEPVAYLPLSSARMLESGVVASGVVWNCRDKAASDIPLYARPGAQPAPIIPEGWMLVPIEPTHEMVNAFVSAARAYMQEYGGNSPQVMWAAMLAAAPEAKP